MNTSAFVLVMSSSQARLFKKGEGHSLTEIADFIEDPTIISDRKESIGGFGDKDNKWEEHDRLMFSKYVAAQLSKHVNDSLLVVAPGKIYHDLSEHLSAPIAEHITTHIESNIVHFSLKEIEEFL